jgi:uncharacterized protein (DUF58 family)
VALGALRAQPFERYERLAFVAPQPVKTGLGGEHRSRRRAPSTDFVDHRAYQPGDDFRRVDWNAYSRLGTLQVRLTEARERLDLALVLDCSASMACSPGKLEFARDLVAALAYVGLGRHDLVRLVCLGERRGAVTLGPLRGRARFSEVVTALQRVEPDGRVPLAERLGSCLPGPARAGGPPLVVLVSDLLSPNWEKALSRLAARSGEVVVLHTLSPQELRPALGGDVRLIDRETGSAVSVTLNNDAIRLYGQRLDEWRRTVEAFCARHRMGYVPIDTATPLETLVFETLRRRGVVR